MSHTPNIHSDGISNAVGQSQVATQQSKVDRPVSRISWIFVVISLISSIFLFSLDNTIVAIIQPSIIKSLGGVKLIPWVSVAYPLGVVGLNLLQTNVYMLFNNKVLYLGSIFLFEIGSAICGSAPNMTALILGRVICGLGGCGIYIGAINLLSFMTTEAERPAYLSLVGLTWGIGTVTGPIIGGALSQSQATWRWCFYLNLVVGAALAPVYLFLLPSPRSMTNKTPLCRLQGIDWIGAIVNAGAVVSLIMAISFGGGLYQWSSGQIIALFVTSGVLWIAFVIQQAFSIFTVPERRIFPVDYLKSRDMVLLFASVFLVGSVVYIPLFYIPLYFQFTRSVGTLQSAVYLLPLVVFQVFGVLFSGAMMKKVRYYFPWYLVGGALCVAGGAPLFLVRLNTNDSAIYGYSVLIGLGSGLYAQTGYTVSQLLCPRSEIPRTVAFIGYGHIFGLALALAVAGSVFLNEATNGIAALLPSIPISVVQATITGTGGSFSSVIPPDLQLRALDVIATSIGNVYAIVLFTGGLTVFLALAMRRQPLNFEEKHDSTSIDAQVAALEKNSGA